MNRRQFLTTTAAGMACLGLPYPVMAKTDALQTFSLEASSGTANLTSESGLKTRVWQYNQMTPGPIIRIKQGETVSIPFTNHLDQPTSVHWHGLRIDNQMDGVPGMTQAVIQPGEQFLYQFTPPDAGTFWYHTHNRSWEQLARGLHGVLIVEERNPIVVDQDLVMVIDDWLLDGEGQLDEASLGNLHDWAHGGRLGNFLSVNGRSQPEFPVIKGERIRLRLVNVANSRIMELRIKGVAGQVIAIDGQPIKPQLLAEEGLTLAPAQRVDLILDMTQNPGDKADLEFVAGKESMVVARLNYHPDKIVREQPLSSSIRLPANPLTEIGDISSAKTYPLVMLGGAMGRMKGAEYKEKWTDMGELIKAKKVWSLNGIADLAEQPLFSVPRGETVIIDMDNQNRWPHAMHIHGHHFKSVNGDGKVLATWRDTRLLGPGEREKIVFNADNPGKWLIHCHMIEHQAGGMVTWFNVT